MMNMYSGVVEDRHDPMELGRYRVRVFGLHSHDKTDIPTESLPWANVLQPATSAAINGVGITPKLQLGSNVIVTFFDKDLQNPLIIGSIAGVAAKSHLVFNGETLPNDNDQFGFTSYADSDYEGESDIAKNARSGGTVGERTTVSAGGISEPQDLRSKRQYPYSQVRTSEGGHFEEWDDTPGNERILTQHMSGTFSETRPDGSQVNKIVNDRYQIVAADEKVIISGECLVVIQGDARLQVGGDYVVDVNQDMEFNVNGNIYFNANDGVYTTTNGDVTDYIVGNKTELIGQDYDLQVSGDYVAQTAGTRVDNIIGDKAEFISGTDSKTVYGNASYTFGDNKVDLVYGNVVASYNANYTMGVFGNNTYSVQGNMDLASLGTMNVSSTAQMSIFGSAGVDLGSGGAINADGTTIDLNSKNSKAALRTVSIIEESSEAFNETKKDDSNIAPPQTVSMEAADIDISVAMPDNSLASTRNGSVPADQYNPQTQGGSGNSASSTALPNGFDIGHYDGEGRDISKFENVVYNLGSIRNKVVNSDLEEILSIAAKESGVDEVSIISGKQPGKTGKRTGSRRHDTGWAVDCDLLIGGRMLNSNNSSDRAIMAEFVKASVALGIRGGGCSPGYMGPTRMHLDTLGAHTGGPPWDSSRVSTWKSSAWFSDAMHDPRSDLQPTSSFIANSQTHNNTQVVDKNNAVVSTSAPPKERLWTSLKIAENLRGVGFNDNECLAAIACIYNESKLKLRVETDYSRRENTSIRKLFTITKEIADADLNALKADPYTWFEFIYGSTGPRKTIAKQLGNIEPGDGHKYIGRGLILARGRHAYETKAKKYGLPNLKDNPDLMATDWDVAIQYTVKYLEEKYEKTKNKDVVWGMRKAIAGSDVDARSSYADDLEIFRSLDRSWLYPDNPRGNAQ